MSDNSNMKSFLRSFFIVLLFFCAVFIHQYKDEIEIFKMPMSKLTKGEKDTVYAKCKVVTNIGKNTLLKIEMFIPCENENHHTEITRKMSRIKSDFLMDTDQIEMREWVKQRDFVSIKNKLLKTINRHTNKPVENIYLNSFLYQ